MKKFYLAASVAAMLSFGSVGSVAAEYTVGFAMGSTTLDSQAMATVDDAVAAFKAGNTASINLVGHSDTVGGAKRNQQVSEMRAAAVRDAMVKKGVSSDKISMRGVGENSLIVATPDGVAEQANRAVVISFDSMAAAPAAPADSGMTDTKVAEVWKGIQVTPGFYYGYNGAQDKNLLGANLSADYFLSERISVGGEQAVFVPLSGQGTFGGRSVASVDLHFGNVTEVGDMGGLGVSVGLNAGGIYGQGVNDDWIYGPEIGMSLGAFSVKAAYDISDQGVDDSTVSVTLGYSMRF